MKITLFQQLNYERGQTSMKLWYMALKKVFWFKMEDILQHDFVKIKLTVYQLQLLHTILKENQMINRKNDYVQGQSFEYMEREKIQCRSATGHWSR